MPHGGHFGLFRHAVPKNMLRPKWRFAKASIREGVSRDAVPAPWRLQYWNWSDDSMKLSRRAYALSIQRYLRPAVKSGTVGSDYMLRILDSAGRRVKHRGHSGFGHPALQTRYDGPSEDTDDKQYQDVAPHHLRSVLDGLEYFSTKKDSREKESAEQGSFQQQVVRSINNWKGTHPFIVRRLMKLCHEYEMVWHERPRRRRGVGGVSAEGPDRGEFPYVDEQASLLDDQRLDTILRTRHRINRRRHPKWIEIQYVKKQWHRQYLRRKAMLAAEVKERQGLFIEQLAAT